MVVKKAKDRAKDRKRAFTLQQRTFWPFELVCYDANGQKEGNG